MHYKAHPAAELFPMLSDRELNELAEDIRVNGQHDPIELVDGLVIDGRNRQEACRRAKIDVKWKLWDAKGRDPVVWVLSKNLHRRHLNESQRALIAAAALPLLEDEAKKRMEAGTPVPRGTGGRSAEVAASAVGASARSVARAKAVIAKAPAARIEAIRTGKATLKQVERETKRAEQVEQARVYVPPKGEWEVITTDYSWEYGDALDGSDAVRGGCPYPPMKIEEICSFPIPCAKDCALFMWITKDHLIDGTYDAVRLSLYNRYGFVPKGFRVWRKVTKSGGPDMGLGRYWRGMHEYLVLLVRGSPVFAPVTQLSEFDAPLCEHSEKPQKAYDDIEAMCPSTSRLEMFARAKRAGWETTGSELAKKKARKLALVDVIEPEAA